MIDAEANVVVCRACISECTEYKSLHKQGMLLEEITTLATLLNFCTGLEIHEEENPQLPQYVCNACVQDLVRCYIFKKKVLETNHLLYSCRLEEADESEDIIEQNSYEKDKQYENTVNEKLDICNVVSKERCLNYEDELTNEEEMCDREANEEFLALSIVSDQNLPEDGENPEREEERTFTEEGEILVDEDNADLEYVVHNVAETTEIYLQRSDDEDVKEECEQTGQIYEMNEDDHEEFEIQITDFDSYTEVMTEEVKDDINNESEDKSDNEVILEVDTDTDPNVKVYKPRKNTGLRKEPNPEYQCKTCGKQLSNSSSFKYHMQLHSDVTPYLCNLCGEGFKTPNAYEGHLSIHDPNNPNKCTLCGKSYRQASSLRVHMLSHTGEKPFTCDICGKGLTQKSGYKKHMLTHTGEKPHSCDICGKLFRYSSNMLAHRPLHTGEKPYGCKTCDKTFVTSEQAKRHILVHTAEKPFSCELCGKLFKRQATLRSHQQSHHQLIEARGPSPRRNQSNIVEIY
uniref:Protein krueppel n=1 Tax=Glossina pallidipes TaxID=7398 RepID=A0A1B0A9V5_GLOPL